MSKSKFTICVIMDFDLDMPSEFVMPPEMVPERTRQIVEQMMTRVFKVKTKTMLMNDKIQ